MNNGVLSASPGGGIEHSKRHNAKGFWAITTYWNPVSYRGKRANYRQFRQHLSLPLLTVELAYGADFELGEDDAEVLIQLRADDVLWQKERLLNLAVRALPSSCDKVAWIDCDVIFGTPDWAEQTSRLLDRHKLVQPFSHLQRMPRNWQSDQACSCGPSELLRSVPFLITTGMSISDCLCVPASKISCSPGYVWAAERELLERYQLYDACVVGGGDSAITRAAYGAFDAALRLQCLDRDHYLNWAEPFYAAVRANVGYVDGNLFHLWHGDTKYRHYRERNEQLKRFGFNPVEDIALAANKVWRWNSGKSEMHLYVRNYFAERREDG